MKKESVNRVREKLRKKINESSGEQGGGGEKKTPQMPVNASKRLQHNPVLPLSAHPGFNLCTPGLVYVPAVATQTSSFNATHNVPLSNENYEGRSSSV